MKMGRFVRGMMISLATLGVCLPGLAYAASQPTPPAVIDVAMADGGVLHGQVVDLQGRDATGLPVSVRAQNQQVLRTTTAKDGHFTVQGLRGGVYQVATGEGQGVYRLWTAKAAPPSAQKNAIVFTQATGPAAGAAGGGLKMLLTNPIVIAGGVATAVAVPVAIANSKPSSP
jgi:hypothetical protein